MKLYFANHRHNFLHWIATVIIRIFRFLILAPFGLYFTATGFILSAATVLPFFPPPWTKKIAFFFYLLPYFENLKNSIFFVLNHWYKDAPVWWAIVVGIPVILVGLSMFLVGLFDLYYALFSYAYNVTHCPFCTHPIKVIQK